MRCYFSLIVIVTCCESNCLWAFDDLQLRDANKQVDKLLVLTNGRVISGELTPRTGGYDVTLPAGRMFVGSDQIRFQAESMEDAYQRMRDSVVELTPVTHLELARWCLANQLNSKAKREILDALHLDPYRTDAKRMLESLIRQEKQTIHVAQQKSTPTPIDKISLQHPWMRPERRSLGGLPAVLAREFTHRIQPLVANKCGNTRCHGGGRNTFHVTSIRNGATPVTSELNLASVLNHLDYANANRSPVLLATQGLHGGSSQPLFRGESGRRQLTTLRNWVRATVAELGPGENSKSANATNATTKNVQTALTHIGPAHNPSRSASDISESSDLQQSAMQQSQVTAAEKNRREGQLVQKALEATRVDELDPDIFNRRYHGRGKNDTETGLNTNGAARLSTTENP